MRAALLLTALALATGPPPAPTVTVRVAVLLSQESPAYRAAVEGFRGYLSSRGIEATLDVSVLGAPAIPPGGYGHDLMLALGGPAALASAASTAPVVVVTLRQAEIRQQGPVTGVYLEFPPEVELAWLHRLLPKVRRVGVIYNAAENAGLIARATGIASKLGLELVPRSVDARSRLPDALASLSNEVQAIWAIADTLVLTQETARSFLLFEFRERIPFVGLSEAWVKAGALYALDRDWSDLGRQCGELAEQILHGKEAHTLAPVPPRKVLYTVNRNTAETLKLTPADVVRGLSP